MMRNLRLAALCAATILATSCTQTSLEENPFPELKWIAEAGTRTFPTGETLFRTNDYGAVGDAVTDCTEAVQAAIDACKANGGGRVTFAPGIYLVGSIFIDGDNINFEIPPARPSSAARRSATTAA